MNPVRYGMIRISRRKFVRNERKELKLWALSLSHALTNGQVLDHPAPLISGRDKRPRPLLIATQLTRFRKANEAHANSERSKKDATAKADQDALLEAALAVEDDEMRYDRLRTFLTSSMLIDMDSANTARSELARLADITIASLFTQAQNGDIDAVHSLIDWTTANRHTTCRYRVETGRAFVYPEGWNEMVAAMLPDPTLDHFAFHIWDNAQDFRDFVARATTLGEVSFALAYGNSEDRFRELIGNDMMMQLSIRRVQLLIRRSLRKSSL